MTMESGHGKAQGCCAGHGEGGGMHIDPVCGMRVSRADAPAAEHDGVRYRFCSTRCRERFMADPARYLDEGEQAAEPAPPGTVYTCPMHPEVRQDRAGHLPEVRHGAGA
ncbi:MAG: hypothetical protein KatS3mg126_1584 [Lysobacteraceae bacterium]|nr:MAG: hypothetical protein KatS3mg126_1584 [Xanthomonadaceae bacterium]